MQVVIGAALRITRDIEGLHPYPCLRSCYFQPEKQLFLIACVDDFTLAGPAVEPQAGRDLIRSKYDALPNGIGMNPPTAVGRYLGCEHRVSERWIDGQGENPTVLDPPPPKST